MQALPKANVCRNAHGHERTGRTAAVPGQLASACSCTSGARLRSCRLSLPPLRRCQRGKPVEDATQGAFDLYNAGPEESVRLFWRLISARSSGATGRLTSRPWPGLCARMEGLLNHERAMVRRRAAGDVGRNPGDGLRLQGAQAILHAQWGTMCDAGAGKAERSGPRPRRR